MSLLGLPLRHWRGEVNAGALQVYCAAQRITVHCSRVQQSLWQPVCMLTVADSSDAMLSAAYNQQSGVGSQWLAALLDVYLYAVC